MELLESTKMAFRLLVGGDHALWDVIGVSLQVSLTAMAIATPPAVAIGYLLATTSIPGRRALVVVIQSLLASPTVVIGLMLYVLLSRQGIFGSLHMLFTRKAMILGQIVIALPVLVSFTLAAVQGADPRVRETAVGLGASRALSAWTTLTEVRFGVMAAVFAAFGRVISEIGCSLMVGGNIAGFTRNISTAIALETSKGELAEGIALGFVLVAIALVVNLSLTFVQGRGELR